MTGIFTPAYSVSKRTGSDGILTDAGISVSTIQRAKQRLRIKSVRERDEQGKTIGWTWQLPADEREADGEEA